MGYPSDHDVGGLKVNSLSAGIGRNQYLEPSCEEPHLHVLTGVLVHAAVQYLGTEPCAAEQASEPASGVGELGELGELGEQE
jgi:hypothetical protein